MDTSVVSQPIIPSFEASKEGSQPALASGPVRDSPVRLSETQSKAVNPQATEMKSRERSQVSKDPMQYQAPRPSGKEGPHASLPSTELKGAQPSERTDGVGALPGNLSESSVALLPDERQAREQEYRLTSPRQRRGTIKAPAAGGDDQPGSPEKVEETEAPRDTVFQSLEDTLQDIGAKASESDGGDVLATGSQAKSQEMGQKQHQEFSGEHGGTEGTKEGRKPATGYGGEYHPAQLHPPPPGASVAECQSSPDAQQGAQQVPAPETPHHETQRTTKEPRFVTMVRGEMKILSGKVRGDEDKVQEGKRLVRGET